MGNCPLNDEIYITNVRHKAALEEAKRSLELVENSIQMQMPEDFFSIDLMNAYEALGSIIGESVGEDLVNEIFSKVLVQASKTKEKYRKDRDRNECIRRKL